MQIQTRLEGINFAKLNNLDYVKKVIKAGLIDEFRSYIEYKLTDENITYYLDFFCEDTLLANVNFDLTLSKKHNDIYLVSNKANSKKRIEIKELDE